jgi:hypothetical protein
MTTATHHAQDTTPERVLCVAFELRPTVSPLMIPLVSCHIKSFQRGSCFKSGDDDFYGFDLQGVISIHIYV